MKWDKYTIDTTTEAEDFISMMLSENGIEGIEIEDNVPLTKEETGEMFIDFPPELPPDEGKSKVSFYLEAGEDHTETLKAVRIGLEQLRSMVEIGSGDITSSQTEDIDWINNWKQYFNDEIRGRYETLHEDLLYTSNRQCFEKAIQAFEFISHLFASIGEQVIKNLQ